MKNILLLLLVLYFLIYKCLQVKETFPFFQMSPSTRNMSLDPRCTPYIEKKNYPFMGSSIEPIHSYKCLDIV
jgi:hypothetical protein